MMRRASDDLSDPDRNLAESTGHPAPDIPEDGDLDLITEESNDLRIHTPPPRIAARFYRPSTNRRKSSAASSRRNSISSAHSHQSHNSARPGGVQSNYIAQHLRRASIIEDRKARLADRAAHAEKVRLRAALAKAAPRSTTNSEERALAAQQAREKNLAEIVAACAEEVKRAKGIAESMKEKREADGKKLRREMEEKLAEAERRREEILQRNNKRGRSLSQPRKSSSPMPAIRETISEATAASRIQQKWRIHQKWKALKDFAALGLTIDSVREISFEAVVDLLAQERVLVSTAQILRICGLKEGETGSVNEMTAVRTFLSAFLILGHPTQVLSSKGDNGEQQQDLVAKARDLLISFENVLSRLNAANNYTPPPGQLSSLSEVYAAFFNAFIAWKARDSSTLIDMMVLQFVELDSIWQSVKDSTEEAVTDSYRDGIRENQLKLMVRIKRLAGAQEGKKLITNAIREARKARVIKKPTGDSRPRAAGSPPTDAPALVDLTATKQTVTSHLQTLTPPATPRKSQHSHADELRIARPLLPPNRIVTHEIAINREYRIEEEALEEKSAIMQTVFNSMRQDVAAGNSDPWILAMAENIRSRLQQLLKEGNSMHTLIGEALDNDVVARELQGGSFSYEKFFSFMAGLLPRLCAPFRDEEIKDIVENKMQTGDVVDRLQALMHGIELMQLDYANFMLQQASSTLVKNAVGYETASFGQFLEETSSELLATEIAWREARTKVLAEAARRDPENVNLVRSRPTPEKIYTQMLVDVFTSLDTTIAIPETLLLDSKRITRIRTDLLRIVTAGAILLQCKNLLKRDVRSQWKVEANRVITVLENSKSPEQAGQGIQAALESSRSMPAATKNHIRELVSRIVTASASISTGTTELRDPVMRLLMTRLRGHIFARLAATTEKEKVKSASTASEDLAGKGLPEFVHKVGAIVEEVSKVGSLDRESHGVWYEVVAKKVEENETSASV
ncbi:putative T-complex protein 11-like protein 1 [Mollisia scopiformis]|uniref:Putative T-complex protein 11-like protein 1 n=1 Tax=Mollisia scopiformis TaxID=149040 RepID=A0A194WVT3_MOLSC|nr:putative T-complex protein 11-like protein 1 [Mollisia scopiformis]KUJ12078.1 putative T-complex protein 11-like protein 1 [Mollisia scopiformis]